jgi:hypothetical protein
MGCLLVDVETGVGYCVRTGIAATGQPCDSTGAYGLSTFCGDPQAICRWSQSSKTALCSNPCQWFQAEPGCPAGEVCQPNGACAAPENPPPAAIGQPCQTLGFFCALGASGYHGQCVDDGNNQLICRELCSQALGISCPAGELCVSAAPQNGSVCK